MSFLEFENVFRSFGSTKALNDLSLSIPKNSVSAFIGANGAGKTTAFSLVGRFIKPHNGRIRIAGQLLEQFFRHGNTIGLMPQDMQFFESRSIYRQLYLFARLAGLSCKAAKLETERVLELVKLSDHKKERPSQLSHGMKIRLGISQALVGKPKLILLDEPTAGLDPSMVKEFRVVADTLRGLTTLVISSHDLRELQDMCDYVCMINKGKLVWQGPMKEALSKASVVQYIVSDLKGQGEELVNQLNLFKVTLRSEAEFVVEFDPQVFSVSEVNKRVLNLLLERDIKLISVKGRKSLEDKFFEEVE